MLALLGWIVLIRYRAMLPLMILMLSVEQVGRMMLSNAMLPHRDWSHGIPTSALINYGLAALLMLALFFSLLKARPRPAA